MSIIIEKLNFIYGKDSPFQTVALKDININIDKGEFIGLIGHTGSGKSTLIQQLNGLLKPTDGRILVNDLDLSDKNTTLTEVRKKVGLVFQYPEYQLFEETIEKDIAFGPGNLGLDAGEILSRVKKSMAYVGLDYETMKDLSPFDLSGGQKRRVAIAGVLAMEPEILILDEPTAGLDPKGRDEILDQIKAIHEQENITVILVSHSMEDVARLVDRLIVLENGAVVLDGVPKDVFLKDQYLQEIGLDVPQVTKLVRALNQKGIGIDEKIITVQEAKQALLKLLSNKVE